MDSEHEPEPARGAETEAEGGMSRIERQKAKHRAVEEAYETRFSWGKSMLVHDPRTGDLDEYETQKKIPRHDVTTAQAIREHHGDGYYVVPDAAQMSVFRRWDGQIWRIDLGEGEAHAHIQEFWEQMRFALESAMTAIELLAEKKAEETALAGGDAAKKKQELMEAARKRWAPWLRYWETLGSTRGRSAVITAMLRDRVKIISDMEFDDAPALMVFSNGVVDFSAAERIAEEAHTVGRVPDKDLMRRALEEPMAHSSTRKVSIQTLTRYDQAARCPQFMAYLESVLPDENLRRYLQRVLGAGLLGQPRRVKTMVNLIGPSNTGKTVLLEVLNAVLGSYCRFTMPALFLRTKGKGAKDADGPSPALHALRKAKYVVASEPDSEDQWNGGLLKLLTGGEEVTSRPPYGKALVDWTPRFLIIIASNFDIKLDTKDEALLRRIAPIRFEQIFRLPEGTETLEDIPEAERADKNLTNKILDSEQERSGIVNWLVEGLLDYLAAGGIGEPEGVSSRRVEMKRSISTSFEFVHDLIERGFLIVDKDQTIPKSKKVGVNELHQAYETWCRQNDVSHPRGRGQFSGELATDYSTTKKSAARPGTWGGRVLDRLAWWAWETWYEDPGNKARDPYTDHEMGRWGTV